MTEMSSDAKKPNLGESPSLKRKGGVINVNKYVVEMSWDEFFEHAKDQDNWDRSENLDKTCVMAGSGCSYDDQDKQGELKFARPEEMFTLDTEDKVFGAETFVLCDECIVSCDEYIEWWLTDMGEEYRSDSTFEFLSVDISYLRPYTQDRLRRIKQSKTKDE